MASIEQVHIAGPCAYYGSIRRQRCGWCGALISEYDLSTVSRALEPGEDPSAPWEPAIWVMGALVAVAAGVYYTVEPEKDEAGGMLAPENSCMKIDIAITN